jgi:2-iminobutanoate/2-iminopropanoate deaminase
MSSWTRINAPELPEIPAFAHAAVAGDHVYVSGMLGLEDDFSGVVAGGIGPETAQALRHVERVLRACDASLADVVKVSAHLPDLGDWEAMNAAYLAAFGSHTPARIAIGCDALLFGARVELDCIAYRRRDRSP